MLFVKQTGHLLLFDHEEGTRSRGYRGCHADRLSRQGPLAKEVAGAQHCYDGFLARVGNDPEFHAAVLNVDDAGAGVTLRVDHISLLTLDDLPGNAARLKEGLDV